MKNISKILVSALMAVLLMACNADQTALHDLEKFTQRMEQKSANWSEADWDDAAVQYGEICGTLQRYDYSDEELRQIGVYEGKCEAMFLQHAAANAKQDLHDAYSGPQFLTGYTLI